jgi:hypothetical protein
VAIAIGIALWSGMWRCPTATLFHFPCPACGSTRAMRDLAVGDFHAVLLNPVAPFVSLIFGFILARSVWLELTDGDLRRLGDDAGKVGVQALVILSALEILVWGFRWLGFFGGPIPV